MTDIAAIQARFTSPDVVISNCNDYGPCYDAGPGPLSLRFRRIEQEGRAPYLVWTDTMKYRMDDRDHPLDVRWTATFHS